jgi:hypothetical protein
MLFHFYSICFFVCYTLTPFLPFIPTFQLDFAHLSKAPGVIGTVVCKLLGKMCLPVVSVYVPANESLEAWGYLLDLLLRKVPSLIAMETCLITDGFPGVGNIVRQRGCTHVRCVHHLAKSILKMVGGKQISTELWAAGRAFTFPKFVSKFKVLFEKNPSAAFFLCPPLALHFSRAAPGTTSVSSSSDLVKKKIVEQDLQLNEEPLPSLEELRSLATTCYGIPPGECREPFQLYMQLALLIQAERGPLPFQVRVQQGEDLSDSLSGSDTEAEEEERDEGILTVCLCLCFSLYCIYCIVLCCSSANIFLSLFPVDTEAEAEAEGEERHGKSNEGKYLLVSTRCCLFPCLFVSLQE